MRRLSAEKLCPQVSQCCFTLEVPYFGCDLTNVKTISKERKPVGMHLVALATILRDQTWIARTDPSKTHGCSAPAITTPLHLVPVYTTSSLDPQVQLSTSFWVCFYSQTAKSASWREWMRVDCCPDSAYVLFGQILLASSHSHTCNVLIASSGCGGQVILHKEQAYAFGTIAAIRHGSTAWRALLPYSTAQRHLQNYTMVSPNSVILW